MIIKGVTEEAKISLDEVFKYFYAGRSARAGNAYSNVFYEKIDFDYIEYIHFTGKIGGDITSNTGEVNIEVTNNPHMDDTTSSLSVGDLIDIQIDAREVTGSEHLYISLDSNEDNKYILIEEFTLYRIKEYEYPT